MKYWMAMVLTISFVSRLSAQQLPIKAVRQISFTATEGSNMDIDVSPDGKTLAFDLLGDLYIVPSNGGKALQITRGMAVNSYPVWSPSGKYLAYVSDVSGSFHVNIRNITGAFHIVLGRNDDQINLQRFKGLVWLNDKYLLVDTCIYDLTNRKWVADTTIKNALGFSNRGQCAYFLQSGVIYSYNIENKQTKAISVSLGINQNEGLLLSPDHRKILFARRAVSGRKLYIADLQTGEQKYLTDVFIPATSTLRYSFSPDSKYIYVNCKGKIHRINVETVNDQIIPFRTRISVSLGHFDYHTFKIDHSNFKIKYARWAQKSADGSRIVFTSLNKVYIKDLPNGKPHLLTDQPYEQCEPNFSADSKWITYVTWCDTIGGHVWIVPAAGGEPEQLTKEPGLYQYPIWSPDGRSIAVIKGGPWNNNAQLYALGRGIPELLKDANSHGLGQLLLINIKQKDILLIADSVKLPNQIAFSGDGKQIYYEALPAFTYAKVTNHSLVPALISKSLNENRAITTAVGLKNWKTLSLDQTSQRSLSPDGHFLVYRKAEQLFLLPICNVTDLPIIYDPLLRLLPICFANGVDPHWEDGGSALAWTYANRYYRINPDHIIDAAAEKMAELSGQLKSGSQIDLNIKPDEIVDLAFNVPYNHSRGMIALKNARIITMKGAKVINNGTIIIKNGRIFKILSNAQIIPSKVIYTVDLKGKTIMPGIIDIHLHVDLPADITPQQSWKYLSALAYGITTARDPSSNYDSYGSAEMVEAGSRLGPRLFSSGVANSPSMGIEINSLRNACNIVHQRKSLGGTLIKQYALPTRNQREYLLQASEQAGLNMTNEGNPNGLFEIAMIKDGSTGIEHGPDWQDVHIDLLELYARSGVYFTPTLQVGNSPMGGMEDYYDAVYWRTPSAKLFRFWPKDRLKKLMKTEMPDTAGKGFLYGPQIDARIRHLGGNVCLGSHGDDEGIGAHNELWALQFGGLTNMEALQAGTILGAKAIGVQRDLGSIEVGKIADLLILNSNPLEDIHNSRDIKYVMKDGILYDGDTLDELWPVYKKCPEWKLKTDQNN